MRVPTYRISFSAAIIVGIVAGIWAVERWPSLRGGMQFDRAATEDEQMNYEMLKAVSPDVETHLRREPVAGEFSIVAFRKTYDGLVTLEARNAFVADTIEALLPGQWERALQVILEESRSMPDYQLLARIIEAGGDEAVMRAAESEMMSKYTLGQILREGNFPSRDLLVAQLVRESDIYPLELGLLIAQAYDGRNPEMLRSTVTQFRDRFSSLDFWRLAEALDGAKPTTGSVRDVLAAVRPLAKNEFMESIVGELERQHGGQRYETTSDNPELVGLSEMKRHLWEEADTRIQSDGADAALTWARSLENPQLRKEITRQVLWDRLGFDGLRPVLLALRNDPQIANPELLKQAIGISEEGLRRIDAGKGGVPKAETFEEIKRIAGDNPEVAAVVERYRKMAGK